MVIEKLSEQAVKCRISGAELVQLRRQGGNDLPALVVPLLRHAEAVSGIPFSRFPVAVELLAEANGGMAVYFSLCPPRRKARNRRTVRLAAVFTDRAALHACAVQLRKNESIILRSEAFLLENSRVLCLKLTRTGASAVHHILLEYGKPYRLSAVSLARLKEHGRCMYAENAVRQLAESASGA